MRAILLGFLLAPILFLKGVPPRQTAALLYITETRELDELRLSGFFRFHLLLLLGSDECLSVLSPLVVDDEVVDVVVIDLRVVVDGRVSYVAAHVVDDVRNGHGLALLLCRLVLIDDFSLLMRRIVSVIIIFQGRRDLARVCSLGAGACI